MLHIILVLILIICSVAFKSGNDKYAYAFVFLAVVFLKTFVDIRSLPDIYDYYTGYQELSNVAWLKVPFEWLMTLKCPEIGFRYILRVGAMLGSFKWSLFIVACINTYAYLSMTKKYSPFALASIIIFLLGITQSIFVIRQHCAIGLTILSWTYIINKDLKKYLMCCVAAFLCHQTALIFLPVYFIYAIEDKKKLLYFLIGTSTILMLYVAFIFRYFARNMVGYEGYFDSNESNTTTLLISLCYYISFVFFLRKEVFNTDINKLLFVILSLNTAVLLAGYQFTGVNRLLMYFGCCTFLTVPVTAKYINDRFIRYCFLLAVIGILCYMFISGANAEYIESFKLDMPI